MPSFQIVATSDLHGMLPEIPACDLLLLGGDLCPDVNVIAQSSWLDMHFRCWLNQVPSKAIIGVAGNHDFVFQKRPELIPLLPWHYLEDSGVTIDGVCIWGTPWQPVFFDWAFNLSEEQLETKWQLVPTHTDILVLHGPPFGYGDRTWKNEHTGSPSLLERIQVIKPRLVICGHIHEARGVYRIGSTLVANVSQINQRYEPHPDVWQYTMFKT